MWEHRRVNSIEVFRKSPEVWFSQNVRCNIIARGECGEVARAWIVKGLVCHA